MRTVVTLLLLCALTGCRYGPPPRIPYVFGTTYVAPDGQREKLADPRTYRRTLGITEVAPFHGGHLIADGRAFEGTVGLSSLIAGRRTPLGPCATGAGALSPDRTRVAWVTTGCPESDLRATTVLHVDETRGTGGWTRTLDGSYLYFAAGFLGDAVVLTGWVGPVRVVPEHGPIRVLSHLRFAADVHRTLVAGRHGVVDAASGRLLWYDPAVELLSFSPNGRRLLGFDHRAPSLLDPRTGGRLRALPRRFHDLHDLHDMVWEDDRHLLAVASRAGWSVLVRIRLDGSGVLVTRPVRSGPDRWVFETQP